MEIPSLTAEEKDRFFAIAIEKEYLTSDVVEEWGFLSIAEFSYNGYMH